MGLFRAKKTKADDRKWDELNGLVLQLMREKKVDEAEMCAQELYKHSRDFYGKENANTATALNNLGFINVIRKDFERAESYLLMSLQLSEKAYGKDSKEVAVVNMNLAKLYISKARDIQTVEKVFREQEAEEQEAAARRNSRRYTPDHAAQARSRSVPSTGKGVGSKQ